MVKGATSSSNDNNYTEGPALPGLGILESGKPTNLNASPKESSWNGRKVGANLIRGLGMAVTLLASPLLLSLGLFLGLTKADDKWHSIRGESEKSFNLGGIELPTKQGAKDLGKAFLIGLIVLSWETYSVFEAAAEKIDGRTMVPILETYNYPLITEKKT